MPKKQIFKTALVEKRNVLNEIKKNNMTLQELRFFSIYLARINHMDISSRAVRFPLMDFVKIMDLENDISIDKFKASIRKLLQEIVEVPNDKCGYDAFQLFKRCRVAKDEENDEWYVEIDAHDDALPLMFEFKDRYFKYELWNVLGLTSKNQFRMYELLKQYENIGEREVSIERLKDWLGIRPEEYSGHGGFTNFKVCVLEACQKALKEKTDICYEFKKGKGGRGGKWLTIIFTIHKNKDYKSPVNLEAFTKICPELKEHLPNKETKNFKGKKKLAEFEYKQWSPDELKKIIHEASALSEEERKRAEEELWRELEAEGITLEDIRGKKNIYVK